MFKKRKKKFHHRKRIISKNDKVDFFHYFGSERGYGCIAKQDISKGELLLQVPYEDCLWGKDEVDLLHVIKAAAGDVHLERVRSSGSLDAVILDPLPVVGKCSFSFLYDQTIKPLINLGFEDWIVAYMLSRCFRSFRGEGFGLAAVPMADQFNHSLRNFNTRFREIVEEKVFVFFAECDIKKGDEILNNYGIESDLEMMLTHGFVENINDLNEIVFPLHYLKEENESGDCGEIELIKINVDAANVIPRELLDAMPAFPEFKYQLKNGLKRAVSRLLLDLETVSVSHDKLTHIIAKDRENCRAYLDMLNKV